MRLTEESQSGKGGQVMIYFDNAATGGFKPDEVLCAVNAALKAGANPGRSGHALSLACAERLFTARTLLCSFFGGSSPDRVVFTKNCTEALNIAILGTLGAGDKIVTTVAEHNSVLRPLRVLEDKGATVKYAPLDSRGYFDVPALISLIDEDTKAVVITLASNVTGISPDICAVRAAMPPSAYLICDGAQACGHEKIDITSSGIDALAVAGHKGMLAAQGSGALIFSERFNPRPVMYGGTGSDSANAHMPDFYPDRLEAGTLNYPAAISLGEGALYLTGRMYENRDKTIYLTDMLINGLHRIRGVKVFSHSNPYGIASFSMEGMQSEEVASRLSEEYGICVRGGLHCAPLMHAALGSDGLVRASLSSFNTAGEVNYFLSAVSALSASCGN